MRLIGAILALALLAGICLPAVFAGWGETVEVRVLDAYGRTLPGASANISWEISKSRGRATTKDKLTDARGRAVFLLENSEFNDADTNYDYTVRAQYGNATASQKFTHDIGETPRTLTLPVYDVTFLSLDSHGSPIGGVRVYVDDLFVFTIPDGGMLTVPLDAANRTIVSSLGSSQRKMRVEINKDMVINLTANFYSLQVRVLDDTGKALSAEVYAGDMQKTTDELGYARFWNLTDPNPLVSAYYGRYRQSQNVDLTLGNSTLMLFDTHPPEIRNIQADWNGQTLKIRAVVQDIGQYASGLRSDNASIDLYYIDKLSVQRRVPMYAIGYNLYEGILPLESGTPTVRYIVQAVDAQGNSKSSADTFVVPASEGGGLNNVLQPPIQPKGANALDFGIVVLALLGIGMAIAIAWWHYKRKKAPSEEEEEDRRIPQVPGIGPKDDKPAQGKPAAKPPPLPPSAPKK